MKASDLWLYSIVASAIVILLGSMEVIGLWSVSEDPVMFGIGVIITGGVMMSASGYGYLEAMSDEVQEILDNLQDELFMVAHGDNEQK